RHRKVRSRLADRADQLAAHLINGREHVLDTGARLGDAMVTPLLTLRQRLVARTLSLNLVPVTLVLQPIFTPLGREAPVRIDVSARVQGVEHALEVLAVVDAGRTRLDLADDLVLLVHVDRELVSEVILAVLLGPGGIGVFLAPLGRLPVSRHRAFLDELVLFPAVALLGRGYQRRIDDLAATGDEAVLEQLGRDTIEQDLRAGFADAVLERPHRRSIRNIDRASQPAEALVAHPVKQ